MEKKKDINIVISNILKTGVFISSFFIITGIVLSFNYIKLSFVFTVWYLFVNINSSTENLWVTLCLY